MRRFCCFLLTLLLTTALWTGASAAEIDQYAVIDGMGKSWYQGYAPSVQRNTMTLYLPLRAEDDGEITVSMALDDPDVFLLSGEPKTVMASPEDGIYPVKLSVPLEARRRNGDYPATITVTRSDGKVSEIPYVIRIRNGYGSHETLTPVLTGVTGALDVGSDGTLTVTIQNPTTTLSATDGVLTVKDDSGEVLMSGIHEAAVPEILPGQEVSVTVPMTVKASAAISAHPLEITLRCKVLGKESTFTYRYTFPVTQEIRLEQGSVQLPTAVAGELGSMTLPLMNMGKGELRNVLVTLDTEGMEQSVLVGTIAPGETKQAKLTFTPGKTDAGTHQGTVTVTCEDVYGNVETKTIGVTVEVDPPLPDEPVSQEKEKETVRPWTVVLIILCVLLTAGLIAQGLILTGKLHKLEEERL